jgi:hypothetical protein
MVPTTLQLHSQRPGPGEPVMSQCGRLPVRALPGHLLDRRTVVPGHVIVRGPIQPAGLDILGVEGLDPRPIVGDDRIELGLRLWFSCLDGIPARLTRGFGFLPSLDQLGDRLACRGAGALPLFQFRDLLPQLDCTRLRIRQPRFRRSHR